MARDVTQRNLVSDKREKKEAERKKDRKKEEKHKGPGMSILSESE